MTYNGTRNIVNQYADANIQERVKLIVKHYSNFIPVVDSFTEGLIYMIEEEQDYNRRSEMGDLGIRVQGGSIYKDRVGNLAVRNVSLRECILNCDFSDGVLEDTDHEELIIRDAKILRRMRRDYQLFQSQVKALDEAERDLLEDVLNKKKTISDVADEMGLTYASAQQKVRRIREKVEGNMISYAELRYSFA